jgi:hypothetical protein
MKEASLQGLKLCRSGRFVEVVGSKPVCLVPEEYLIFRISKI